MMQLYSRNESDFQMQPKKETVQFLLDFSRATTILRSKPNVLIELNLN